MRVESKIKKGYQAQQVVLEAWAGARVEGDVDPPLKDGHWTTLGTETTPLCLPDWCAAA